MAFAGHPSVMAGVDSQPHEGRDGSVLPITAPPSSPSTGPGEPQGLLVDSPLSDSAAQQDWAMRCVVGRVAVPRPPDSCTFPSLLLGWEACFVRIFLEKKDRILNKYWERAEEVKTEGSGDRRTSFESGPTPPSHRTLEKCFALLRFSFRVCKWE